jgi:GNAT superfamily N-acetyltransferase
VPTLDVTTTFLEMLEPGKLRARTCGRPGWQVRRAPRDVTVNRDFYRRVGADWSWTDRLPWTLARWQQYLDQPGVETWIGYLGEDEVGYFELDRQPASGVEIAYFGLLPAYLGRGLGGVLLSEAILRAWQLRPHRVWVHTCTLDHPQALGNYLARGFAIYKTETHRQEVE